MGCSIGRRVPRGIFSAAVLPKRISSQGDDSGGQYTERPGQFARNVRSPVAGEKEVAVAGPRVLTVRFWPWGGVSANQW